MIIRNLEAIFSFKYNPEQLKKATASLDDFAHKANFAISAIAGSVAIQALRNFVNNTANLVAQIDKTSSKLGVNIEALQSFRFAALQSGISSEAMDKAFQVLIKRSAEAAKGGGEAKEAFSELGLSVTDSAGRLKSPVALMYEMANGFGKIKAQGHKVRLATKFFDDEGIALINMLKEGSQGLETLKQEAHDLGFVLGKESTEAASKYVYAINRLQQVFMGLKNALAVKVMPALTAIANFAAKFVASFNSIENRTSTLRVILLSLGGAFVAIGLKMVAAFAPVILTIAAIGAGIGLVSLIIDDIWTAFEGGESVLRSLHKKAREFFEPLEQWLLNLPKTIWHGMSDGFIKAIDFVSTKISQFQTWILSVFSSIQNAFSSLLPDFLNKASFKKISTNFLGLNPSAELPSKSYFTPQNIPSQSLIQNKSNQSVNVSVNVKTGANPQEIGGEISKVVRKELEKERINAFMGVNRYAN